ncbi:MAG TPA: hypothetical protein ENJ57_00470 [Rhizobiales bacterium]|nr:hypothetical protein [Hyphomicrobiales bacterium]
MGKKKRLSRDLQKIINKITPDLKMLLDLLDQADEDDSDSVVEDNIRSGAHNLLIARRIIKHKRK